MANHPRRRGSGRSELSSVVVSVLVAALLAGCSSAQDPSLVDDHPGGSVTTSHTLGTCPPGGPDATTPAAGCLDSQGRVQRP